MQPPKIDVDCNTIRRVKEPGGYQKVHRTEAESDAIGRKAAGKTNDSAKPVDGFTATMPDSDHPISLATFIAFSSSTLA